MSYLLSGWLGRCLSCLVLMGLPLRGAEPLCISTNLPNGIRVAILELPGSSNVMIFSFLSLGLTGDEPDRAQWSHLLEHLLIRSTLRETATNANAETMPDHMRLDVYATLQNWREGLAHHRQWLEGVPFSSKTLSQEKPKVNRELEFTARNFATYKFAMVAWAQAARHGTKHIALKGDVERASVEELENYRQAHLMRVPTTIVVAGAIPAKEMMTEVIEQFGKLANLAPRREWKGVLPKGARAVTWDIPARHLVLSWSIPRVGTAENAALTVAAQMLTMRCFSDPELQKHTGQVLAGANLELPEGCAFYISAPLKPEGDFDLAEAAIEKHLAAILNDGGGAQARMVANQIRSSLSSLPNPSLYLSQLPAEVSREILEANLVLQWATQEHQLGSRRHWWAEKFADLDAKAVRSNGKEYLKSKDQFALRITAR